MPPERVLGDEEVRRLRSSAQLLHRDGRRPAVDLVRELTGVQAQVLSAAGLALRARTRGLVAAAVDQARLVDRSIVLTWAMRGTLHLLAAEDHGWLVPLVTRPRIANAYRRLKQEGMPADQPAIALGLVERMLEREGPLSRREIAVRLHDKGIHTAGQSMAHLLWLASAQGTICHGPLRAGEQCFALVREWLGRTEARERDGALAELALRYLGSHAPAEPADLAFWSGIALGEARRAWRLVEDRLAAVQTVRGTRWSRRSRRLRGHAGVVRLLPSFDEYLLGWRDRSLMGKAEHWSRVNRGGGWIHPVVFVDGQVNGTWRTERKGRAVTIQIDEFSPLTAEVREQLAIEAADVARFLGASPEQPKR
jgi:winged helix DNA-binding protein